MYYKACKYAANVNKDLGAPTRISTQLGREKTRVDSPRTFLSGHPPACWFYCYTCSWTCVLRNVPILPLLGVI